MSKRIKMAAALLSGVLYVSPAFANWQVSCKNSTNTLYGWMAVRFLENAKGFYLGVLGDTPNLPHDDSTPGSGTIEWTGPTEQWFFDSHGQKWLKLEVKGEQTSLLLDYNLKSIELLSNTGDVSYTLTCDSPVEL